MRTKDEIIQAQSRKIALLKSNLKGCMNASKRWEAVANEAIALTSAAYVAKHEADRKLCDWKKGNGIVEEKPFSKSEYIFRKFLDSIPIFFLLVGYLAGRME